MNLKICKQTKDNFFLSPDVNNHCTKIRRCAVELNPFNNETPHFVAFVCFDWVPSSFTFEINAKQVRTCHLLFFHEWITEGEQRRISGI